MEPLNSKDPKSIGGFTLVGRLGKGGMGVVYLASRKSESVALKVIRDSLIDDEAEAIRFTREVATLEKISSANVAGIVDAGVEDGRAWFAAEFVNGPNLTELVNDKGPLHGDRWWSLARGLLRGLADVHQTGTIHRDVKPANVIIAEGGPKLIDFGIAHVSDATSVTATGLVAGSPAWFSPEQIEGFELTPATDVFSAGSLLTFAASGSSPWGGETTMTKASVFKILYSEPDLTGLSAEQCFLLEKMLEKEPSERPTAESLIASLGDIRDGQQPELGSSYVGVAKKTNDATTTSKRDVLNETVQEFKKTGTNSIVTETSRAVGTTSSKKKNLLIVAAVSVIAVLGVSFLAANSSGSGQVSVAVAIDEGNPAIGDFSVRLSSGSIEPVVLDLSAKESHDSVFRWKSGEPIRVAYDPPFSEDEEFVGTIMPSDLGLNGFSNGQHLYIQVSLEETSTLLSFRTGANLSENDVYAIRLARGNEQNAIGDCVTEQSKLIEIRLRPYKSLHQAYLDSRERARLDFTAWPWHTNEVWATRAGNLLSYLESDLSSVKSSVVLSAEETDWVGPILESHQELLEGWSSVRTGTLEGSRRGTVAPQPDWDNAWNQIRSGESALRTSSARNTSILANNACREIVQ